MARPTFFSQVTPIDTVRFTVRLITEADVADLLAMNGDPEVTRYLPYATWQTVADGEAWFGRMRTLHEAGDALQYVIVDKASGRCIGSCLLFRFVEGSGRAELGYALARAHWGKGVMHEALTALIGEAFATYGLRRLEAEVNPLNLPSGALLGRLRFTREGLLRQRWVVRGQANDVHLHGLLRDDWVR